MQPADPFNPYPDLGTTQSDLSEYEHTTVAEDPKDVLAEPEMIRSFPILLVAAIGLMSFLSFRLIDLQIVEGTKNRVLAEGNRIRTREIRPPRGDIFDRHGAVLASTTAGYSLELYPAELPRTAAARTEELTNIETVTGLDLSEARQAVDKLGLTSLDPIVLADQIPPETALAWQLRIGDVTGVAIKKVPQRTYASVPGLGHILGYVGRVSAEDQTRWPDISTAAHVGKTGLEIVYEDRLQGIPGEERIEVDARGRVERVLAEVPPTQGQPLTTTLDARLQDSLTRNLVAVAAARGSRKAAAVALNPKTGEILALVSLPSYDPNSFVRRDRQVERQALFDDPDQPLLNRAIAGTYPSGSTIKPILAAAALEAEVIQPTTTLDTSAGVITVGQWQFPDWKVHGVADVTRAIAESNDIFFYAVAGGWQHIAGLGPDRLQHWLTAFGFGAVTGIDLPGETTGLVPTDAWKREYVGEPWYIGDSYHVGIGQGYFLATPLQMARATATIASGQITPPHFELSATPAALSPAPVAERVLALVRTGMRLTVTDGTARSLNDLPIAVAGKTGTAQFASSGGDNEQTHSWFTGFAPAADPTVVVAILVEGGGESTDTAVPVAKAFFTDWASLPVD